jgi:plastocyanin
MSSKISKIFAVIFIAAFIGIIGSLYLGYWRIPSQVAALGEYVPGLKRWPGPATQEADPVITETLPSADVEITVQVYTSAFNPKTITVKEGQVVKLILKGMDDGVLPKVTGITEFTGHGFHVIGPYDIWVTGLRKGVTREIFFKATTPGEFDIECTVWCSPDHYLMRGKLIVQPRGG